MKLKKIIWCLLWFLICKFSFSQKQTVTALSVGDKVPEIKFGNVLNYKSKKAKISDFKGKLVILDMWSTWCSTCIAAFPRMEEFQKKFNQKIQILLVNPHDSKYDSEVRIKTVLEKNKMRTGFYPSLPIAIGDRILNIYFPHLSVPHEIWIDSDERIIAITSASEVTMENIQALLESKKLDLPIKDDWAFDYRKPLLMDNNAGNSNDFVYRSIFTKYIGGIGSASGLRSNEKNEITGFYILNHPLRQFIRFAYSDMMNDFMDNRVVLQVTNPEALKSEFDTAYTYCYDLTIPPTSANMFDQKKYLQNDLKQCFSIFVRKEKQEMRCLVITATDKINTAYSKKDKSLDLTASSVKKYIHNYSVADVIKFLNRYSNEPLIDETGISQRLIDIDFPDNLDLTNHEALNQILKNAGFNIKEEERELEVMVITDKNQ